MNNLLQEIHQVKDQFVCKSTGDELLLIPLRDNVVDFNQYLVLNELGAFIWSSLSDDIMMDTLILSIRENFDVSLEELKNDLEVFIPLLHQYSLNR